jgi:hypothetical protein
MARLRRRVDHLVQGLVGTRETLGPYCQRNVRDAMKKHAKSHATSTAAHT